MSEKTNYTVSETQKQQFAAIYLLEYMINAPKVFQLMLEREEEDLEPILEWLLTRDFIQIKDQEKYAPTEKGRDALQRFMRRYTDFLTFFDVFCAVDLQEGTFAFASYFDFDNKLEWQRFLNDERWEDLRVAVAAYKGIDPVEIVFMSFLSENRFGRNETGWQFDLLLGSVWDEILEICKTAVSAEQLGWEDDDGFVPGESVIKDVIEQGLALIEQLHIHETAPHRNIEHQSQDSPSEATVQKVDLLAQRSNRFDATPEPPDEWQEPWSL
ncbi:hypothetical protein [Pelagicoccus sp. SDUM812003]|uniref:hypothetical protein n=1 Tax=Pelagicoccus sp. SDUM812003 TaxID=3041267 RepID=UPI00280CDFEA|nr:hypothetical protein [Pelagicoccus sp. SDUM812003]MDQ8204205.1 hypothetical protein [Pelagicoccus sp. SDUM812003]